MMKYADFLAFLAPEGKPPIADPELTPELLSLAHLTSAPPWAKTMKEVLKYHREYRGTLESQPQIKIVEIAKDLLAEDKIKVVLGLQNPPGDSDVNLLYKEGIRITTLAYEGHNEYGGGFASLDDLTKKGKRFIISCAEAGSILDLSHAGCNTAAGALRFIDSVGLKIPVVASHSGGYNIHNHPRNIPFYILRDISNCGGIVGIPTLTFILDEKRNDLEPFFNHLHYMLQVCGEDFIVIGGDGPYCTQDLGEWEKHIGELSKKLDTLGKFKPRFPHHPFILNTPRRMEVLDHELKRRGLSSSVREKILGKNLFKFLERNLPQG